MEMPDFTAYTQDGKAYTLSDMKGKVVVIDFLVHRLYSLPCGNALLRPSGRNIQRPSGSIPVRFVGYRRPIDGTVEKDGVGERREITCIEFESARRFPFRFYGRMNIRSVPRVVLVDKDGHIVDAYAKRPSDRS